METRRTFLKALPCLGAGVLLSSEASANTPETASNGICEEAYTFDDHESVVECRKSLFSCFAWIPSDLRYNIQHFERLPFKDERTVWLVWKEAAEGPRPVDYWEFRNLSEYRHLPSRLPSPGFVAWLNAYAPQSTAEVAVAMSLYRQHLFGKHIDFANLRFEPHPRVDACLRPTRGMILWINQKYDLFDMAGSGSRDQTQEFLTQYALRNQARRNPGASAAFDSRFDPTLQSQLAGLTIDGRPLLGILNERLVFGEAVMVRPENHEAAERLEYGL